MTQLEEKKMLAEFMGWSDAICEIEFDDFNDLMEVVEKIEGLGYDVIIYNAYTRVVDNDGNLIIYSDGNIIIHSGTSIKLASIYRACVEFVKWWNEQNEKEVKNENRK